MFEPNEKKLLKLLENLPKDMDGNIEASYGFTEKLYQVLNTNGLLSELYSIDSERETYEERELESKSEPSVEALEKMVEEPVENIYPHYQNIHHAHAREFIPAGSLGGINFIYDHDKDYRILLACYKLQTKPQILALYERKGHLTVFASSPVFCTHTGLFSSFSIDGDEWCVDQYIPVANGWVELTEELFKEMLVKQSQFMRKYYRLPS